MQNIREHAFNQLINLGILVSPEKRAVQTEVMPWIMKKVVDFLEEDQAIDTGTRRVVLDGIMDSK